MVNALKKKRNKRRKKRTDSIRARTQNYFARLYSSWENQRGISRTSNTCPFVEKKRRNKKTERWEKWRTRCKYIRFTAKSTGRKCAEGQSPSATGDHIYVRRRNSRWRWITWSGFKARSPPSRMSLTRRASSAFIEYPIGTLVSLIDATRARARARVSRNISAIRQSIEYGPPHARLTCLMNFTRNSFTCQVMSKFYKKNLIRPEYTTRDLNY